ncbi:hypothetical protein TNCT_136851 [Trichonephila clavata]|uniref:Uncharacterized protein n=1 Tax=Trichonephila clavata TaxID=2740835 RepID=A0A8X6GFC5_TRICU|nr:hypothetical protein TNCT_136851 [Trichonephila clavata]
MQHEGKKKMKRGQNSYKKSHSKVDFDLKQDSEKEPWDSQRGVGEKEIGWIQKEPWDHNGRGGEKGILQKELGDGDSEGGLVKRGFDKKSRWTTT